MKIHNLSETTSIANQYLAELRDVDIQLDRMRFRRNLERLGQIFAYEISKGLTYGEMEIETPLGFSASKMLAVQPTLATIFRAGMPMHQGMLSVFDQAQNSFVSAYRREHEDGSFEIKVEYVSTPNIEGRPLVICDPMLATGRSMTATLRALEEYGKPSSIHVVVVLAARDGIDHLERNYPEATLWAAGIDEELTAKSYIVPGLGDAGDLAYGEKHIED